MFLVRNHIRCYFLLLYGVFLYQTYCLGEVLKSLSLNDTTKLLSNIYLEKAEESLSRYIPSNEYRIVVRVKPSKVITQIPYGPFGVSSFQSLEKLSLYVEKVEIELFLSERLKKISEKIGDILKNDLNLDRTRGDSIRYSSLGLELAPEKWLKEKEELKSEVARLEKEKSKLSNAAEGFLGKHTKTAIIIFLVGLFLFVFIAAVVLGRSIILLGRNIGNSVSAVAGAMENMGNTIRAVTGTSGEKGVISGTLEAKMLTENTRARSGGTLTSLPIESLHSHFLKLRQEILDNLNENSEAVILKYLTFLLSNPATVGRAVVTLELLGRDVATEFFKRLGVSSQEALLKFMREGVYDAPKAELMFEAGEELKTKLLVDSLDLARGRPSEKVAEKVLQLTDEDLLNVVADMSMEHLPRFFLYLDSSKIALILSIIKRENEKLFEKVLSVLSKMPKAETASNYDQEILRVLDNLINKTRSDIQRPFLKIYQEIIESVEDDLGEEIVLELSNDPRLADYFELNVVTIHTFFTLNNETFSEMLEKLSNKDIAALIYGIKEEERKRILQILSERRKGLVKEEYETLTARSAREAKYAYKRVRDSLVKRLKDMKNQGLLQNVVIKERKKMANLSGIERNQTLNEKKLKNANLKPIIQQNDVKNTKKSA